MKKAKAARVPVLENAFEVNLPKLMQAMKATGDSRVVLDDGNVRTVAMLSGTWLAVFLGGRPWVIDIVPVQCLKDRVRPLLKCPRAHEGKFQSLYYHGNELACRHCHELRYRTNVAASPVERARLARAKLLVSLGVKPDQPELVRSPYKWRKRHLHLIENVASLSAVHYEDVRAWLNRQDR